MTAAGPGGTAAVDRDRDDDGPGEPSGRRRPTVVIGLDGSPTSWDAFAWGCGEASRLRGRALAVFVSRPAEADRSVALMATGGVPFDVSALEQATTERAEQLGALARRRGRELAVDVDFVHARGDRARQLLRVAGEVGASVVAVGRSTKRRHHLAGSLGRHLLGARSAPIVVVVP